MDLPALALSLRDLRVAAGLTHRALCARLDLATATIANVERGARKPSIDLVLAWVRETGGRIQILPAADGSSSRSTLTPDELALLEAVDELSRDSVPDIKRRRALILSLARGVRNASPESLELLEMQAERLLRQRP